MAKTTEKLVLSLDAESQTFRSAGHNLSAEQAVECTNKIQTDGGTAVIIEQQRHHRALSFHRCHLCTAAAEAYAKQPEPAAEQPSEAIEGGRDEQPE